MVLYQYECTRHGPFEALAKIEDRDLPQPCPTCKEGANRVLTTAKIRLEGVSGHFPDAADRWARIHENHGYLRKRSKPTSVYYRSNDK